MSDVFSNVSFPQGTWGSGGFDGVGFYTGGSIGSGTATLSGTATAQGSTVNATLNGVATQLVAYSDVAGGAGIVLATPGFGTLYIFLNTSLATSQHYTLTYNFGAFDQPCFAAGTRIATARGEVAVERLQVGDRVAVLPGRRLARIVWLGHRRVACALHPRGHDVWPVRIAADAFAPGMPYRDLLVSPDHALFIDGNLVPARLLLNGATITQERVASVTYWHVELEAHGVLLANGLPAESYLDTGNRRNFDNTTPPIAPLPRRARAVPAPRQHIAMSLPLRDRA